MSPIGEVDGEVAAPEHEITGQTVEPEPTEHQERAAEHEQARSPRRSGSCRCPRCSPAYSIGGPGNVHRARLGNPLREGPLL